MAFIQLGEEKPKEQSDCCLTTNKWVIVETRLFSKRQVAGGDLLLDRRKKNFLMRCSVGEEAAVESSSSEIIETLSSMV